MDPKDSLQQGIQALALNVSDRVQAQLLTYVDLLVKWNQVYNLTAVRHIEQMIPKHLLDSLAVLPYLRGPDLLDVGSGAGLPGLVLAIACPQQRWVLLDSQTKKIRFLRQVVLTLQLSNIAIIQARVETFQPNQLFDTIICRAFAKLRVFYQQTLHLGSPTGRWLAMKGHYPKVELAEMAGLPISIKQVVLPIPQLQAERQLVILQKTAGHL